MASSATGFLYAVLKIRSHELRATALHFFYLLNVVGVIIIGRTVASSLFLTRYDPALLPWMYVASAAAVSAASWIYSRLTAGTRLDRLILATTLILLGAILCARVAIGVELPGVLALLYVLVEVMGSLLIIQFWSFANTVHNTREAKRLFGVIGAGGVLANIIVGFGSAALVATLGTENLLFVMALALVMVAAMVVLLGRSGRQQLLAAQVRGAGGTKKKSALAGGSARIFASKHLRIIAGMVMLTFVVTTLVDYQFKILARATYDKNELTAFFALLYGFTGLLSFFIQLFVTGRLLERFGIVAALSLLPFSLGLGSAAVFLFPSAMVAALAKGGDAVFRYTVNDATTQLLYLPVPAQSRLKAKAFIDGILKPVAYGGTGLTLALLMGSFETLKANVHWLALPSAVLCVAWIGLVLGTRSEYVKTLLETLRRRRLDLEQSPLRISDDATIQALVRSLGSDDVSEVKNALELIRHVERHDWDPVVVGLLDHESPEVRTRALAHLAHRGSLEYGAEVFRRVEDPEQTVRAEAITAYCAIGREKAIRAVQPFLEDESPEIRAAAMVGMIRFGGLDGVLAAAESLKAMLENEDPVLRRHGARVLGAIRVRNFYQPVLRLLGDPDLRVRLAAIESAGQMRSPELVLPLIYKLGSKETAPAAITALALYGAGVERTLSKVLANSGEEIAIRRNIPPVLGRLATVEAANLLARHLDEVDGLLRSRVCRALNRILYRHPGLATPRGAIERALSREARVAFEALQRLEDLELRGRALAEGGLLAAALEETAGLSRERIFLLLGVIYPTKTIEVVHAGLSSEVPAIRANALEVLDNTLTKEHRGIVLPLVDDTPVEETLEVGRGLFELEVLPASDALEQLLADPSPWVCACALRYLSDRAATTDPAVGQRALPFLDAADPLVRETAGWVAGHHLEEPEARRVLDRLAEDPSPLVRKLASLPRRPGFAAAGP
ncbi:MAG: Npt1/Npt2 family nucleotide transporter [Deltaproteobacteria bacterium]|nr:Npt1/Npt2 family nucleotide transporter [Deltaproteobacteria bacterium]